MQTFSTDLVGIAALAAGLVNAIAGGGTLITFPTLTFVGIPAIAANVTSMVALCPGHLGATLAQARELRGQRKLLWLLLPLAVAGGTAGGALLAVQDPVRAWLTQRGGKVKSAVRSSAWVALPVSFAAIYGGYFSAGLSIIVLSVLGMMLDDTPRRLNAVKQAISFSVNVAAALFFLFSGHVVWFMALVMALGCGGASSLPERSSASPTWFATPPSGSRRSRRPDTPGA